MFTKVLGPWLSRFIDSTPVKVKKIRAKIFLKELKSYFIPPRLFLTLIHILVLGILFKPIETNQIKYYFIGSVWISFLFNLFYYLKRNYRIEKKLLA
jgi:hypothetical protein